MPFEYKPKTKFFITTRSEYATEKVNKWLDENYDHIDIADIKPFMSYDGARGYMIGCMVLYSEIPSRNEQTSL